MHPRVQAQRGPAHQNLCGPQERSECHQMVSAGAATRLVLGRHDTENMVHREGDTVARLSSSPEGDLHHQMVAHWSGHGQRQSQPFARLRLVRLDSATVGDGTRPVRVHTDQARGASLLGRLLARWPLPRLGQLRQVRSHLVHAEWPVGALVPRHGGHLRGVLELEGRQSWRFRVRRLGMCFWDVFSSNLFFLSSRYLCSICGQFIHDECDDEFFLNEEKTKKKLSIY